MNPALKTFLPLLATMLFAFSTNAKADDFNLIKERVDNELLRSEVNDRSVQDILDNANDDGSFQGINYDDLRRIAGFPHAHHILDLVSLAKAYKTASSRFYQDEGIKSIITRGLEFWVAHDFIGENWHNNVVTTPTILVQLMLLIGEELPADLVEQTQPIIRRATVDHVPGVNYWARPGGDRITIASIVAKNLLFMNDREEFDHVIQIIAEETEVRFATGERGMQHDYSFHHRFDRVNNTLSYGYGKFANIFGEWATYVANTDYQFPKDKINHLVDYYLDGIYKHMVYGVYIDIAVYAREIAYQRISKPGPQSHWFRSYHISLEDKQIPGPQIEIVEIERLLQMTDYRSDELKDILKLRLGEEANIRSFAKFFWQSEHFAFQRPNFYTSVRMHSTRNMNAEVPHNGVGTTTHHRGDGSNYLSMDAHEYDGIWPVYDWQKVSGATIMQKSHNHVDSNYGGNMPVQMEGLTDYVGGVVDGLYGAVGYDFKSPHDLLEAKKAWFFFDNEYVCLGAGIKSYPNLPAFTTVNQALMRSDVTVMQGGRIQVLDRGKRDLDDVKWVHQDNVGYIMPEPATVHLSNQHAQGSWADINATTYVSDKIVTEDVFLLGFNHGERPRSASYQYIVVPDVTPQEVASTSANNRNIRILSNTPDLQGVMHNGLNICQLVFYKAGEVEISDGYTVKMDSQGMAMLKMNGNRIGELSVSDPSRKLTRVTLTLPGIYNTRGENFITIPNNNENITLIVVDLPTDVYAGSSRTIEL